MVVVVLLWLFLVLWWCGGCDTNNRLESYTEEPCAQSYVEIHADTQQVLGRMAGGLPFQLCKLVLLAM